MAVGTVLLTATHASSTCTNPGNAQTDNASNATISAAGKILHRQTGDGDSFPALISITKVEIVAEIVTLIINTGSPTWDLESKWGGVSQGTVAFSTNGVKRLDVTSSRSWTKADFSSASLEGVVRMNGGTGTSGCTVDYLWYEVTYSEQLAVVVDETINIVESAPTIMHVVRDEVVNGVEGVLASMHVVQNEVVNGVESLLASMHVVQNEVLNIVETIPIIVHVVQDEVVNLVEGAFGVLPSVSFIVVVDEVVSIVDGIGAAMHVKVDETISLVETKLAAMHVVVDEVVSIVEDLLAIQILSIVVSDTISIVENFVRRRFSFVPPRRANASTFTGTASEVTRTQQRGMQPWPVKTVPIEKASHIDQKTITHMHQMFRNIYSKLKRIREGTNASTDSLMEDDE